MVWPSTRTAKTIVDEPAKASAMRQEIHVKILLFFLCAVELRTRFAFSQATCSCICTPLASSTIQPCCVVECVTEWSSAIVLLSIFCQDVVLMKECLINLKLFN